MAERLDEGERVAMAISGISEAKTHLYSTAPPTVEFANEAAGMLSEERYPAMLVIDLALIGHRLVHASRKPLFLIDVSKV